jgi:Ca2+-binding EF-hand superfamily protein
MIRSEIRTILNDEAKLQALSKAAFDNVDVNNSGVIDETELGLIMQQISLECEIPNPTESDVREVMNELDANRDGRLTFDEFSKFMRLVLTLMKLRAKS